MIFDELKQIVLDDALAGGELALDLTLLGAAVDDVKAFFAEGQLLLSGVTTVDDGSQSQQIVLAGNGAGPFEGMGLNARFDAPQGVARIHLDATGNDESWTLADAFASLTDTVLDELEFGQSGRLQLASYTDSGQSVSQGMNFAGTLPTEGSLSLWTFLLGQTAHSLSGEIQLVESVPEMTLSGAVNSGVTLDFLPELPTVELSIVTESSYNAFDEKQIASSYLRLETSFAFEAGGKSYSIPLAAAIHDLQRSIVLRANLTALFDAGLDELAALLNNGDINSLIPEQFFKIEDAVRLTDLIVNVDPSATNKIGFVSMGVETTEKWVLLKRDATDVLALEGFRLTFQVSDPMGSRTLGMALFGEIDIGSKGVLAVCAIYPGFTVHASLQEETVIDVRELVDLLVAPQGVDMPDLQITALSLQATADTGDYSVLANVESDWTIGSDSANFTVEQVYASIARTAGSTSVDLRGVLGIGGVEVTLEAALPGSGEGWQLDGSTGEGQEIPIGRLVGHIAEAIGAVTVPAAIEDLVIENLHVAYNTKSKDFTFTCESKFPVEDQLVDITVTIDLKHADGVYSKEFGGVLKVSGLDFTLKFLERGDDEFLLASYDHDGSDKSVNLHDMVSELSPDVAQFVPDSLAIDLKDALFAFSKTATESRFVFGLDLSAGFSLSKLPLVGKDFPPEATAGVDDLQLLVASKPFDQATSTTLNSLLPSAVSKLPAQGLESGLVVTAVLNLGDTQEFVSLPVTAEGDAAQQSPPPPAGTEAGATDNAKWFKIQKALGPVYFDRVGVQYQDSVLWFLLDAALSAAGLTLSLDGLSVGSGLSNFDPKFDLHGLGIDYKSGPLEIGGAFLRQSVTESGVTYDEYDGAAVIKTEELSLSAIGSYANPPNGDPSLFIYAVLDYPLGGPAFFFVTGLAAGFGYNRSLLIPPVAELAQFPLISVASDPAASGGTGSGGAQALTTMLDRLRQYVPVETGEYFGAAGIKFTSFKIVDSFALLTVSFGHRFELDILGLSTLVTPPEVGEGVTPLAEIQLALRASFIPDEGFLGVSAELTPASFLLSRDCHLTGGFAFYSWFSGEHAGDFVLTVGGYHPRFDVPAWYPKVPRLGFNWQVDSELSMKGDIYYALTGSALMAGGHLEATWESGSLKAWFTAGADFLIAWKPYHYDAEIYVDMGVSYTFHFFGTHHITVDLGADLHVWGPDFTGTAHIHLWIVTFDVSFGASARKTPEPIDWSTFRSSFLPAEDSQVCSLSLEAGLVKTISVDGQPDVTIVNPKDLSIVTNSAIPSKRAVAGDGTAIAAAGANAVYGIGSMAVRPDDLSTVQTVTIERRKGVASWDDANDDFALEPILKGVPEGLWGQSLSPDLNAKGLVPSTLAGFRIRPTNPPDPGETRPIDRTKLQYDTEPVPDAFEWGQVASFEPRVLDDADRRTALRASLGETATVAARTRLLDALGVDDDAVEAGVADDFLVPPQIEEVA